MAKSNLRWMVGAGLVAAACSNAVPEPEEPVEVTVTAQAAAEPSSTPPAEVAAPRRTTTPAPSASPPTATAVVAVSPPASSMGMMIPGLAPVPPGSPGVPSTTATPVSASAAPMLSVVIANAAGTNASGMQAVGSPSAAQFAQGQVLVVPFNVSPGKCLTVVGVANGITELDLQLTVAFPIPNMPPVVLAQDATTGPTATIGPGGNCFKSTLPIAMPALIVMKATQGAGLAVMQIFEK